MRPIVSSDFDLVDDDTEPLWGYECTCPRIMERDMIERQREEHEEIVNERERIKALDEKRRLGQRIEPGEYLYVKDEVADMSALLRDATHFDCNTKNHRVRLRKSPRFLKI